MYGRFDLTERDEAHEADLREELCREEGKPDAGAAAYWEEQDAAWLDD